VASPRKFQSQELAFLTLEFDGKMIVNN